MNESPTPRNDANLPVLNAPPLIRLDAFVAEDGSTVVNGHLLEMGGVQQPNEAILDAIAMFARTLGAPVAATVIDRTVMQVARLRVHPDGSSRTIAEDEDLPPGRERTAAEEQAFPRSPGSSASSGTPNAMNCTPRSSSPARYANTSPCAGARRTNSPWKHGRSRHTSPSNEATTPSPPSSL